MSNFLLTLAILSLFFTLWQWLAARLFPIHQRLPAGETFGFSVLKPLKGASQQSAAAVESWFRMRAAGGLEILFGVASMDDPAWNMAEGLIARYSGTNARLVHAAPLRGTNAKVSALTHLLPHAQFEHLIISDDDVLAPDDLLDQIAATWRGSSASLVSTFYTMPSEKTFGNKWEAVATNADFWSQVLQGVSFQRMDFALGAVMATTRGELERAGGFASLLDFLADDYQLGRRIAAAGGRIALCAVPVECPSEPISLADAWRHQLRWARTIRTCRPLAYFLSILSNPTWWPLLYVAVEPSGMALGLGLSALFLRSITAWDNYRRITRRGAWLPVYFAPIKDLLQVLVWAGAFLGNRVTWRGEQFRVSLGGRLIR